MNEMVIDPGASMSGPSSAMILLESTASMITPTAGSRVPPWIPASQRYYWSSRWQRDQLASLIDIENGDTRRFENPIDAIRWLLSDED